MTDAAPVASRRKRRARRRRARAIPVCAIPDLDVRAIGLAYTGKSAAKIGQEIGKTGDAVRAILRKYNVPLLNKSPHHFVSTVQVSLQAFAVIHNFKALHDYPSEESVIEQVVEVVSKSMERLGDVLFDESSSSIIAKIRDQERP